MSDREPKETDRLTSLKRQTEDVAGVARENLQKVMDRGDNLSDLQGRAESLRTTATEFDYSSKRLKRKLCWQNIKLWIILLIVLLVILVVLIVAIVVAVKNKKSSS